MEGAPAREVTGLLGELRDGDPCALPRLLDLVYDQLRHLASGQLKGERPGHTLQTTALVHEAYLRLVDQRTTDWQDRGHFLAVCATSMRRVLTDHARRRLAGKRGGGRERVALEAAVVAERSEPEEFLALADAVERLSALDERKGRLAELRLFSGVELAEIARILRVSLRTAENDWRLAKAWLRREMKGATR